MTTVENYYTLPCVGDVLDQLSGAQYLSCFDAASGFHQIMHKHVCSLLWSLSVDFPAFGLTRAPATCEGVHEESVPTRLGSLLMVAGTQASTV